MLKNLEKQYSIIHIAGREYKVRYSLNCLLYLETEYKPLNQILKTDYQEWSIDDVLQLTRAAMCDLHENYRAVNRRDFDNIRPSLSTLGRKIQMNDLPRLRYEIVSAIVNSMPKLNDNFENENGNATNEGHLRSMYVDIIGRPEKEFWRSNNREISERIDYYLETKGLKDTPVIVRNMFDDE